MRTEHLPPAASRVVGRAGEQVVDLVGRRMGVV